MEDTPVAHAAAMTVLVKCFEAFTLAKRGIESRRFAREHEMWTKGP